MPAFDEWEDYINNGTRVPIAAPQTVRAVLPLTDEAIDQLRPMGVTREEYRAQVERIYEAVSHALCEILDDERQLCSSNEAYIRVSERMTGEIDEILALVNNLTPKPMFTVKPAVEVAKSEETFLISHGWDPKLFSKEEL